jgi:DNA-binding MarR family transcriptional regulator
MRRLLALLSRDGQKPHDRSVNAPLDRDDAPNDDQLLRRAKNILQERQRRMSRFGRAMFGEPAWEILLLLYVSELRYTTSRLVEASGATRSTAMRWIDYLEKRRFLVRTEHPTDRRSAFVALTHEGKEELAAYLSGMDEV